MFKYLFLIAALVFSNNALANDNWEYQVYFYLARQQVRGLLNSLMVVIWTNQKQKYLINLLRKAGSWFLLQVIPGKIMLLISVERNSKHNPALLMS